MKSHAQNPWLLSMKTSKMRKEVFEEFVGAAWGDAHKRTPAHRILFSGVIPKPPLGLFAKKQAATRMLKFDNFGSSGIVKTMAGDQNESFAIRSHLVNANQTKCATVCETA